MQTYYLIMKNKCSDPAYLKSKQKSQKLVIIIDVFYVSLKKEQ